MKIIFAGTPDFSVPSLESLYEAGYNIDLVVTQEDSRRGRGKKLHPTPVKKKAKELGLDVYQPTNINSKEALDKIRSIEPDFIIVIAYGQIFKKELLDIPKYKCINIHASILPKYRGAAPIHWAIINGEEATGVTIMEMEEGLDSGRVYHSKELTINDEDNVGVIHDKLAKLGAEALIESLEKIADGRLLGVEQNHKEATYADKVYKDTGKIDWSKNSEDIINLIRGVTPWPGAYTNYKKDRMKVFKAKKKSKGDKLGKPGQIVDILEEGLVVQTGDGLIILEEIQFPNKRRMFVHEYIAGNSIEKNSVLK